MKHKKLVLFEILVGVLLVTNVKAIFPYDALAGGILRLIDGGKGHPNATEILAVMTLTTSDFITRYDYPYEKHVILTSDGYLLEMHRIPNIKSNGLKSVPIIMAPGLMSDSGSYVMNGAKNSPAFIFWNAGYDVWLHNNRGTRYCRKHQTLSPDLQKEFWNFSFNEMGIYDLPAAIDYVTSTTKSKQVYLLGHSMGGTLTAIFLAEKPDYSDKVKAAFLLAPAIINKGTYFPFVHYLQLLREDPFLENLSKTLSGTNVKVMRHFLQLTENNGFRKYDYGTKGNMAAYGTETPPHYRLDKVDVPVSIFYGTGDYIVVPEDIIEAAKQFKNLVSLTRVNDMQFDHLDFILSKNVKFLLYDKILSEMSELEPNPPIAITIYLTYMFIFVSIFVAAIGLIMVALHKSGDKCKV